MAGWLIAGQLCGIQAPPMASLKKPADRIMEEKRQKPLALNGCEKRILGRFPNGLARALVLQAWCLGCAVELLRKLRRCNFPFFRSCATSVSHFGTHSVL
jgi:hypothetical protein